MPDLLIRNVPAELHARLKAAAAAHRRSVTQEAIQIIENNLLPAPPLPGPVPTPIQTRGLTAMEDTPHSDEGQKNRSQPGWAKDSLRILHPVEGPAIPESDWNMLHDDREPLK